MTDRKAASEQTKKFRDAARELECDESEGAFNKALKKVAGVKSAAKSKGKKPAK